MGIERALERLLESIQQGSVIFLGLLCVVAFLVNAGVLFWLAMRKSSLGLTRCPKCGRTIACPHCTEDEQADDAA